MSSFEMLVPSTELTQVVNQGIFATGCMTMDMDHMYILGQATKALGRDVFIALPHGTYKGVLGNDKFQVYLDVDQIDIVMDMLPREVGHYVTSHFLDMSEFI